MGNNKKSFFLTSKQQEINIAIGKRLKQARLGRKIIIDGSDKERIRPCTQTELSKKLDCTFQQIQKYEKGSNTMCTLKMVLASKFLNIPLDSFTNIYDLHVGQTTRHIVDMCDDKKLLSESKQLDDSPTSKDLN